MHLIHREMVLQIKRFSEWADQFPGVREGTMIMSACGQLVKRHRATNCVFKLECRGCIQAGHEQFIEQFGTH